MTDEVLQQVDGFSTPGSLLKAAREEQGMSSREAADRLHLMPDYVTILEDDDYHSLRSPSFARGYLKAYGRLLGVDEASLLSLFERIKQEGPVYPARWIETKQLQLQRTGLGVAIGLGVMVLLVVALWWWRGDQTGDAVSQMNAGNQWFQQEQLVPGTGGDQ